MGLMEIISLILATAAVTAPLAWFLTARRYFAEAAAQCLFASVWREGYVQGVADQEYAAIADFTHDGYGRVGPNRANPYPGDEDWVGNGNHAGVRS